MFNKKRSLQYYLIIILIFSSVFATSGCQQHAEIGDLAVVLGTIIEPNDNGQLQVSIELAHKDQIDGEDESVVIKTIASSWDQAEADLESKLNKQLYFGHMILLVLGSFDDETTKSFLEQFYSDKRLAPTIYVALSYENTEDLLAANFGEAVYVSKGIAEYLALELKEDKKLYYTVEKCMQGLYYEKSGFEMANLVIEKEKILVLQMVKFNEF